MSALNYSKKYGFIKLSLALSDFIFFTLPLFAAILLISIFGGDFYRLIPKSEISARIITHVMLALLCVGWFWIKLHHYIYRKPFWLELKEILRVLLVFSLLDLAFVAFSKWQFSWYVWAMTWSFTIIMLPLARIITKHLLNDFGMWERHTVIIGSGKNARDTYAALHSEKILGLAICLFFSNSNECETELFGIPVICDEKHLWQRCDTNTTQFIVALDYEEHDLRDEWLKKMAARGCRSVSVIPMLRGVPLYGTEMSFIFSHEVMILRVSNNLTKRTSRFIKRAFDIVSSIAIIILLSPVFAILVYKISKDGGQPIYGHERIGQGGVRFKCLKFRSMVPDAQEVLRDLLANDVAAREEWEKDFKLKNDPRITAIGKWLRQNSIDELPQLFNVLKGDMSLVGPRPIIATELERYAGNVDYYLMAKPGMTGLWQVSGRNDVDYDKRVYFDAWYVKNWSLWNDISILFKTITVVLKRYGAY